MNKKDIYHLIMFPVLCFLLIAVGALFFSNRYSNQILEHAKENQASEQKFERFVENIKSGKWPLTSDQWIEGLKRQRIAAESEYQTIVPLNDFLQWTGWFSLILAGFNVLIVLYVKDNIKKRQNTSATK